MRRAARALGRVRRATPREALQLRRTRCVRALRCIRGGCRQRRRPPARRERPRARAGVGRSGRGHRAVERRLCRRPQCERRRTAPVQLVLAHTARVGRPRLSHELPVVVLQRTPLVAQIEPPLQRPALQLHLGAVPRRRRQRAVPSHALQVCAAPRHRGNDRYAPATRYRQRYPGITFIILGVPE